MSEPQTSWHGRRTPAFTANESTTKTTSAMPVLGAIHRVRGELDDICEVSIKCSTIKGKRYDSGREPRHVSGLDRCRGASRPLPSPLFCPRRIEVNLPRERSSVTGPRVRFRTRRPLADRQPSVDAHERTVGEARRRACEEQRRGHDLLGTTRPPERVAGGLARFGRPRL